MQKRLLIISPYFPPDNTADIHRIRQSLPYYDENGWDVQVIAVDSLFTNAYKDMNLLMTIPHKTIIHKIKALNYRITRKIGLGSIALRSLPYYFFSGNKIIKEWRPDIIFFSTTQFPVMILGFWWKWRYKIPYVLDFQDPWHHDHYLNLPPEKRPPKFWFSYYLNKTLEPLSVKNSDGLIAVNQNYINTLIERYKTIRAIPYEVIPFGASESDTDIKYRFLLPIYFPSHKENKIRLVYTGVINNEMIPVIKIFFEMLSLIKKNNLDLYRQLEVYFIGTNYETGNKKHNKLDRILNDYDIGEIVTEIPEREGYLRVIQIQKCADILMLPGTTDKNYIASKIAPYLVSGNPILALFHSASPAIQVLANQPSVFVSSFKSEEDLSSKYEDLYTNLLQITSDLNAGKTYYINNASQYMASDLTKKQTELFDLVININRSI